MLVETATEGIGAGRDMCSWNFPRCEFPNATATIHLSMS